jgi:ABC-type nitrate/sulfonate/bicarbonate transport system substrate-binding protein
MKRDTAIRLLAAAGVAPLLPLGSAAAADAIRVIGLPIDTGLEVQYAQAGDLVAQSGLSLQVQNMYAGAAVQAAITGGAADVGLTNVSSLATAREKGLPLVLVASAGLYDAKAPSSVLMVANDAPFKTARDLNGKIVAVNGLKSISQLGPEIWIDKNGGDSSSVKFIDMPFAEMPQALATHRIDAALIAEPQATTAKKDARVFSAPYDAIGSRFLITAWFSTAAWVSANPDQARKFATMIYRAAAWCNRHRAQTGDVLIDVTKLDPAIVRAMPRVPFDESPDPASLKPHLDAALKYGLITKPVTPEELFAPELLHA